MRILFIHTRYLKSAGGEDTALDAELRLMESKGHTVKLLLFNNGDMGKGLSGKIKAGISSIYNKKSAEIVKNELASFSPDIVHVHNFFFTASPAILIQVKKMGIPLVVTLHNFRLICSNSLLLRKGKVCELCVNQVFPLHGVINKCYHDSAVQSAVVGGMAAIHKFIGTWKNVVDMYLTPSEFIKAKLLASSFNAPASKLEVKYNFVEDPGTGQPDAREPFYLFVGRLSEEKGVSVLLEAWKDVRVKLVIAGDGPAGDVLVGQYAKHPDISFIGKQSREQVLNLMKRCRALVFPSIWYEGLPMTIVEALATGTPVIASEMGGMKEMISNNMNGKLFKAGDANDLARALLSFEKMIELQDYSLYLAARKSYLNTYHPGKCYESTMKIYNRLTNKTIAGA